jgi:hypothetical protein
MENLSSWMHAAKFLHLLGLCAWTAPVAAEDQAVRHKYLAILGDWAGCRTFSHNRPLSGGVPFNARFGAVYSTDITPDQETGIGKWTADQFYRVLHEALRRAAGFSIRHFAYIYFWRFSRRDSDALLRFPHTLKPVPRKPPPNRLIFPANLRFGLIVWKWLVVHKMPPAIPSGASAEWKRREFLVNGRGHWAACHTPKNLLFGEETGKALSGGVW